MLGVIMSTSAIFSSKIKTKRTAPVPCFRKCTNCTEGLGILSANTWI